LASTGGLFSTNSKATVTGYGLVWFSERAISNIFSLANMIDKFRVIMDSGVSQAMTVKTPQRDMIFCRMNTDHFVYKPKMVSVMAACEKGSAYVLLEHDSAQQVCNTIADPRDR
jgi:hypothetical protein